MHTYICHFHFSIRLFIKWIMMFAMNLCLLAASRESQQHDGININKTRTTAIDISKLMGEMLKGLNIIKIYLHLKSVENGRNIFLRKNCTCWSANTNGQPWKQALYWLSMLYLLFRNRHVHTYMIVTTTPERRSHAFERSQGGVYVRFWKEGGMMYVHEFQK